MRAALLALLLATPAAAQETYVGVILGSWHVTDSDALSNDTPGLTWGRRWPASQAALAGLDWQVEGGVFRNSYGETAPLALVGLSTPTADLGPGTLRVTSSAGFAYYPTLAVTLKDERGVPNIAGYLPITALTLSYDLGRIEWRITALPPGTNTTGIFNLSVTVGF